MKLAHVLTVLLIVGGFTTLASAQSGAGQRLMPWGSDGNVEAGFDVTLFGDSDTEDDTEANLDFYEGQGRLRLDFADPDALTAGFDVLYIDIDSNDARLPDQLTDERASVGLHVGEWSGWSIDVIAGAGFAGDEPYDDGDAWFAHANLIATHQVDENHAWIVMLNYDGNRVIFPDIPLPAIGYRVKASDELTYTLGLPASNVFWRPTEQFYVSANYVIPFSVDVTATYAIVREFRLYASYDSRTAAFHLDGARDNDRLFYQEQRFEGGVRWVPCDWFDAFVAGGYAFDRQFSSGWHIIDDNDEIELDAAPYIRFGVTGRF